MADLEIHKAYKTAKNEVHYDWEWMEVETGREEQTTRTRKIPVQVPVEYIKFVSAGGVSWYMPMSELLSRGLGGLSFSTATQAINIERNAK